MDNESYNIETDVWTFRRSKEAGTEHLWFKIPMTTENMIENVSLKHTQGAKLDIKFLLPNDIEETNTSNEYYYIVFEERMMEKHLNRFNADWLNHSIFINSNPFLWMENRIKYRDKQGLIIHIKIINAIKVTYFTYTKYKDTIGMTD